ncbi:hypothetical protein JCM10207_001352 [Rhodosporidiobolus poonsookiae]
MALSDRTIGSICLSLNMTLFTYYTLWTLITPLLPDSSPLLLFFPLSREWAIRIPALILLFGLSFVGMVTGFVLVETARRKGAETGGRKKR